MKHIMIVEDDDAIRESLLELLDSEGYAVSSAINGDDGIQKLKSASPKPDLILLDLMMPVKDGLQFCAEKRELQELAPIPVLIMSADNFILEKTKQAQASGSIKKPVDIDELVRRIRQLVGEA